MRPLLLVLCCSAALAQPEGVIRGVVADAATRSPLAGASVVVSGTELGAACDAEGRYVVFGVPAGSYTVEASMIGYESQARTGVDVAPGRTTELPFQLRQTTIMVGEVKVRAEHFPKVKDAPVSERSFSTEEIQSEPAGAADIQRVVQAMPAVVSTGDQNNEIVVRGGSPQENLFLLDDIEIPFPNHFGTPHTSSGGGISMLNALLVREVDFIAGALPARYGERASSAMDIKLRRGSEAGLDGSIDLGMAGLGAIVEFPLPGRGNSFIGSYHKSFLAILDRMKAYGTGDGGVPEYDNALAKVSLKPAPGHELELLGLWGVDRVVNNGFNLPELGSRQEQFGTDRYALGAGWQKLFGELGFGKLTLFGSSTDWALFRRDTAITGRSDTLSNVTSVEANWGGRYDISLRLAAGQETQAGVKLGSSPFQYRLFEAPDTWLYYVYDPGDPLPMDSFPLVDSLTGQPVVQSVDVSRSFPAFRAGGFLQHRLALGRIGDLTLGGRADWYGYTRRLDIAPRVGFSTRPFLAGVSAHAGLGWHFQPPPTYALASDPDSNHYLRSRRSDHYIIGLERTFGDDAKLSVEAYIKQNRNLPLPEHWATPDAWDQSGRYLDIGTGISRGIELFIQKRFSANWHATLAYSLADMRIADPQHAGQTIPGDYDFRNVLTASGSYTCPFYRQQWYRGLPTWFRASLGALLLSDQADYGARFRYMGGRPYTPRQWRPDVRRWLERGDSLNSVRLPDYMRLDLRWGHKFLFRNWNLAFYFEVWNVLDRENIWWYEYNDDGTVEPYLQFRFFPVGGLVVEF